MVSSDAHQVLRVSEITVSTILLCEVTVFHCITIFIESKNVKPVAFETA